MNIDILPFLFSTNAFKFGEYKLKNGTVSDYYISLQSAMSDSSKAVQLSSFYAEYIIDKVIDFDFLLGVAYKGIPLAALVSSELYYTFHTIVRWGYNRKEEKLYGNLKEKLIVGDLKDGDRVLIIDDVITTGQSKIEVWNNIKNLKSSLKLIGILVAVDRRDRNNRKVEKELKCPVFSLLELRS